MELRIVRERRINEEWPTNIPRYAWRRFEDLPLDHQLQLMYLRGQLDRAGKL